MQSYLRPQLPERHIFLQEESRNGLQRLEAPDVLQDDEQVPIKHHERRGDHWVFPPVPHHPQNTGPDEEDEGQPTHVRDAPSLDGWSGEQKYDDQTPRIR